MPKTSSPIVIGDKEYHKYLIIWEDICGDSTIVDYNEFTKMSVAKINTEAYIFKKTDKYVWSYSSYYEDKDVPYSENAQWLLNLCLDSFRLVEEVSRQTEIPIVYYEDLYTDEERFLKTNKKFNLGLEDYWEDTFNPKLRLRLKKETPWRTTE